MSASQNVEVTLVEGGGIFTDANGQQHFIKGYGQGRIHHLDLDPRIDLTRPIWQQAEKLAHGETHNEKKA